MQKVLGHVVPVVTKAEKSLKLQRGIKETQRKWVESH